MGYLGIFARTVWRRFAVSLQRDHKGAQTRGFWMPGLLSGMLVSLVSLKALELPILVKYNVLEPQAKNGKVSTPRERIRPRSIIGLWDMDRGTLSLPDFPHHPEEIDLGYELLNPESGVPVWSIPADATLKADILTLLNRSDSPSVRTDTGAWAQTIPNAPKLILNLVRPEKPQFQFSYHYSDIEVGSTGPFLLGKYQSASLDEIGAPILSELQKTEYMIASNQRTLMPVASIVGEEPVYERGDPLSTKGLSLDERKVKPFPLPVIVLKLLNFNGPKDVPEVWVVERRALLKEDHVRIYSVPLIALQLAQDNAVWNDHIAVSKNRSKTTLKRWLSHWETLASTKIGGFAVPLSGAVSEDDQLNERYLALKKVLGIGNNTACRGALVVELRKGA